MPLQVDDFELAEETPVKAPPRSRTRMTASPDAAEPQARRSKPPASAERRTAEWLTALSPVIEHDECSPASQPGTRVADASLGERGMPLSDNTSKEKTSGKVTTTCSRVTGQQKRFLSTLAVSYKKLLSM